MKPEELVFLVDALSQFLLLILFLAALSGCHRWINCPHLI